MNCNSFLKCICFKSNESCDNTPICIENYNLTGILAEEKIEINEIIIEENNKLIENSSINNDKFISLEKMEQINLNKILENEKQMYNLRCEKFKNGFYFIIFNCLENDKKKCIICVIDLDLKISNRKALENNWYQTINKMNDSILIKLLGYETILFDHNLKSTKIKLDHQNVAYSILGTGEQVLFFKKISFQLFVHDLKLNKNKQLLLNNFDINELIICQIEYKNFKYYINAFVDKQTEKYSLLLIFENNENNSEEIISLNLKETINIIDKFSFIFDYKNHLILNLGQNIQIYNLNGSLLNKVFLNASPSSGEKIYHFINENDNRLELFATNLKNNNFHTIYRFITFI
jgi:hypothetical protein